MIATAGIIALAILLPTDSPSTIDTTPLACQGTSSNIVCMPEESPEGGYPTGWADNSPTYSDGWMLKVDDYDHPGTIQWIAPTHTDTELEA